MANYELSVGMPTYDDYDGVYFSVQALRLYHADLMDRVQILVVDNNPGSKHGKAVAKLMRGVPNGKYIPNTTWHGPFVKDVAMREGDAPFAACMDGHVLLWPDALPRLLQFYREHPDTPDLFQGPLVYNNLTSISTHFEPVWRGQMWGTWATDPRGLGLNNPPFEIPMQGMGLFTCSKKAWDEVGGFNPRFRGFGGEEGYIHIKFRQAGRACWCLPFLRWVHRFDRPAGIPFRLAWQDKVRNYFIGFLELGLDPTSIIDHFAAEKKVNRKVLETMLAEAAMALDSEPAAMPEPEPAVAQESAQPVPFDHLFFRINA